MDQFLDWAVENQAETTVEWHRFFCQSFKDHIGEARYHRFCSRAIPGQLSMDMSERFRALRSPDMSNC